MVNVSGPEITLYEDIWPALEGTQINRAAIMLHYLLNEWKLLYRYYVHLFVISGKFLGFM